LPAGREGDGVPLARDEGVEATAGEGTNRHAAVVTANSKWLVIAADDTGDPGSALLSAARRRPFGVVDARGPSGVCCPAWHGTPGGIQSERE
jgi:hypothetical protein